MSAAVDSLKPSFGTPTAIVSAQPTPQTRIYNATQAGIFGRTLGLGGLDFTPHASAADSPYIGPGGGGMSPDNQSRVSNVPLTGKYTGWDQTAANADYAATGGDTTSKPAGITDPSSGQYYDNPDDYYRMIDEAYNPSFDYLGKAEAALRGDLPDTLQSIEGNNEVSSAQLAASKDQTMGTLNSQQLEAQQRKLYADAANRRLHDEQRMGYRQRFGGMSSAGQAASELSTVEQQRQLGNNQQNLETFSRDIAGKVHEVETNFALGQKELLQRKQDAITQANRDFQNKLLQIEQNRADLNMNKAQARLQALQNLRNQVFQINLQNMQFQQTLEAQKQASLLDIQKYQQTNGGITSSSTNNLNQFASNVNTNPQTSLSYNDVQNGVNSGGLTLTGMIGPSKKSSFDFLN